MGVKDNRHKWVAGDVVPAKGRDPFVIDALAAEVLNSGHAEVEIMSDQEPAILALRESVAAKVRAKGGRVRLTDAPLHDPRGNGLAESGIKEIKDQTRALLAATGSASGKTISPDSVLVPWMLRYAGAMLNDDVGGSSAAASLSSGNASSTRSRA